MVDAVGVEAIRKYVYDAEDIVAIYDGSDALLMWFVHGPEIDEPCHSSTIAAIHKVSHIITIPITWVPLWPSPTVRGRWYSTTNTMPTAILFPPWIQISSNPMPSQAGSGMRRVGYTSTGLGTTTRRWGGL